MVRVKNILKIITIIAFIVAITYTFVGFTRVLEPTDTTIIYWYLYFAVIALSIVLQLMPDRVIKLDKIKDTVEYNEFQAIYQEILSNYKTELDKYRRRVAVKRILQGLLIIIFILTYMSIGLGWIEYLDREIALLTPYIVVGAIVLFLISIFVKTKSERLYKKIYKEKVIGNLTKSLGKDLTYSNNSERKPGVLNAYAKAGFDIITYNRSEVDDYITGVLDEDLNVSIADIDLEKVTGTGKNRRRVKIFAGMFVDITTNKNIVATIKVLTNRNKKHSKMDLVDKQCEKLEMDSPAFEKHFNVYTDNKIVAMQVLTSEILEMLTELRDVFGVDMEIVIKNNHVYLRFHTGSMFEAKVFGGSIKKKDILIYYGIMKMTISISKKINEVIVNVEV